MKRHLFKKNRIMNTKMDIKEKKIEFKDFDNYRVTHHLGSELIKIEVLRYKKSWFTKKHVWEKIYFGHASPIQFSLDFYNKSRKEERKYENNLNISSNNSFFTIRD